MSNTKQPKRQVHAIVNLDQAIKDQIDSLYRDTIYPALCEDFIFSKKKDAEAALSYLKQKIRNINVNDFCIGDQDDE